MWPCTRKPGICKKISFFGLLHILQQIVRPRCPTKFEGDRPFVYRATCTAIFFRSVPKRVVLGELKLFRILVPLHVAMITRAGQRSRKAVSQTFFCSVFSVSPQRFSLRKAPRCDVPAYVSSMTWAKILQGCVFLSHGEMILNPMCFYGQRYFVQSVRLKVTMTLMHAVPYKYSVVNTQHH